MNPGNLGKIQSGKILLVHADYFGFENKENDRFNKIPKIMVMYSRQK